MVGRVTREHRVWRNALRAIAYRYGAETPTRVREWLAADEAARARTRREAMTVEARRAEWLEFVRGAELVIHNAAFDVGFLDMELQRCGPRYGRIAEATKPTRNIGATTASKPRIESVDSYPPPNTNEMP